MSIKQPLKSIEDTGRDLKGSVERSGTGSMSGTGVFHPDGTEYHRGTPNGSPTSTEPPSGSGDDGGVELTLSARVRMLEIGGGILFAALLGSTIYLLEKIDSRFDRVDEPLGELQSSISAQTATLNAIERRMIVLEDDRGSDTQASSPAKPTD